MGLVQGLLALVALVVLVVTVGVVLTAAWLLGTLYLWIEGEDPPRHQWWSESDD